MRTRFVSRISFFPAHMPWAGGSLLILGWLLLLLQLALTQTDRLHPRALEDAARSTEDFLEEVMTSDVAMKLHEVVDASPPPPPRVNYVAIQQKALRRSREPWRFDMTHVHLYATAAVCAFIALAMGTFRCWRARQLRAFLNALPDASEEGTWLVVAYEWDFQKMQSGRMPLEGISSISELVTAAVEYGAEHVDAEIREDNVDVRYMDLQAVERRVGAKTRFADVARARVLRISRRKLTTIQEEKATLVKFSGSRKKASAHRAAGAPATEEGLAPAELDAHDDMDDHSIYGTSEAP